MSQISCDTIPDESVDPGIPLEEPYVVIELENGVTFTDWSAPISLYFFDSDSEVIYLGARTEQNDIVVFELFYEGELQHPEEIFFDREPWHSSINAKIDGTDFTTTTAPGNNRLYDIHLDLQEKRFTARFDVTLVSSNIAAEPLRMSGTLSTHQWNLLCVIGNQVDSDFKSEFCQSFEEYR